VKTTDVAKVRATLWAAADELRANSKLTPVQYRDPVLGLVRPVRPSQTDRRVRLQLGRARPHHSSGT
jgi:hypothetical protein